jgi:hypothetical protein
MKHMNYIYYYRTYSHQNRIRKRCGVRTRKELEFYLFVHSEIFHHGNPSRHSRLREWITCMQYYAFAMTVLHFDVILIEEASQYYAHKWIYVKGTQALDNYELFLLGHDSMLFPNFFFTKICPNTLRF